MSSFKRQLKLAIKIIVEDVHKNYEAYRVVGQGDMPPSG
jgi:hypothetical protein